MHVANSKQYLANIEHCDIIAKTSIFPETIKELSSWTKLENHIDKGVILKCSFQRIDEGMIELS